MISTAAPAARSGATARSTGQAGLDIIEHDEGALAVQQGVGGLGQAGGVGGLGLPAARIEAGQGVAQDAKRVGAILAEDDGNAVGETPLGTQHADGGGGERGFADTAHAADAVMAAAPPARRRSRTHARSSSRPMK